MFTNLQRRFFMPYITGAGCLLEEGCEVPDFPTSVGTCVCTPAVGGINELYFIPCTEEMTEANVALLTWWSAMLDAVPSTLGRSGIGLGSIGKKGQKNDRLGSCRTEQITVITWALKFQIKCFDKTSARSTQAKLNVLIQNGDKFLVLARMCDGDNEVLPIGRFVASDMNWTVPDNFEENQVLEIELSWQELGIPTPVTVPSLSTVLPKLS